MKGGMMMNNNHDRIKELLPLYIDNELSEKDEADVLEHLAECDACQNELNMLIEIQSAMKLEMIPLPDGFHEATMAKIEQDTHKVKSRSRFDYRRYMHVASILIFVAIIGTIGFRLSFSGGSADKGMATRNTMIAEDTATGSSAGEETRESVEEDSQIEAFTFDDNANRSSMIIEEDPSDQEDSGASDGAEEENTTSDDRDMASADSEGGENAAPSEARMYVDEEATVQNDDIFKNEVYNSKESGNYESEEPLVSAKEGQNDVLMGSQPEEDNESIGDWLWIFIPLGLSILIGITYSIRQRHKSSE